MGQFVRIKTNVVWHAPAWQHCNCMSVKRPGQPTTDLCRFCVKEPHNMYRCTLYNMRLGTADGILLNKTEACKRASAGFKSEVEAVPEVEQIMVDPKIVIKDAITRYQKIYKQLIAQGYTDTVAQSVAKSHVMGG